MSYIKTLVVHSKDLLPHKDASYYQVCSFFVFANSKSVTTWLLSISSIHLITLQLVMKLKDVGRHTS